jgi:glutamine synthetase
MEDGLELPDPIQEDPGTWSQEERDRRGVDRLATTPEAQVAALLGNPRVTAALGAELTGAFVAVRHADAAWAADRPVAEIVAAHLWQY